MSLVVRLSPECCMSADGFITTAIYFTAGLLYLFGEESLTKIEIAETRANTQFHVDAPSLDCQAYFDDYLAGNFSMADLLSYVKIYTRLVKRLKTMRRDGDMFYCSPSWV